MNQPLSTQTGLKLAPILPQMRPTAVAPPPQNGYIPASFLANYFTICRIDAFFAKLVFAAAFLTVAMPLTVTLDKEPAAMRSCT